MTKHSRTNAESDARWSESVAPEIRGVEIREELLHELSRSTAELGTLIVRVDTAVGLISIRLICSNTTPPQPHWPSSSPIAAANRNRNVAGPKYATLERIRRIQSTDG